MGGEEGGPVVIGAGSSRAVGAQASTPRGASLPFGEASAFGEACWGTKKKKISNFLLPQTRLGAGPNVGQE